MAKFRVVDHKLIPIVRKKMKEFVEDEKELIEALEQATLKRYADFAFISPEGDVLDIAVANESAHVQFTTKSGEPPYLYATKLSSNHTSEEFHTSSMPSDSGEISWITLPLFDFEKNLKTKAGRKNRNKLTEKLIEFDIGGTPTPLPMSHCVSLQDATNIVVHYFRYRELSSDFEWRSV